MKKILCSILIISLFIVFAGCSSSSPKGTTAGVPGSQAISGNIIGQASPSKNVVTAAPSGSPAGSSVPVSTATAVPDNGLVNSYENFAAIEVSSINHLGTKVQNSEDQEIGKCASACMLLYSANQYVMPIIALAGGTNITVLEQNGYSDVVAAASGDTFTVTYTFQGNKCKIDAKYDTATSSLTATVSDAAGTGLITFEYTLEGSAYAVQCTGEDTSGGYSTFLGYIDGSTVSAYGQVTTSTPPQSIFKNNSLGVDFVKSGTFYCVLSGSNLSVYDNGTTSTY